MKQLILYLRSLDLSIFLVVGVIGFIVDAAVLKVFLVWVLNDPIMGRLISFPIAVSVTFLLNRRFTFRSQELNIYREWITYVAVNMVGLIINILTFMLIMLFVDKAKFFPILVLAAGSFVAMFFNYFGAKYLVFKKGRVTF